MKYKYEFYADDGFEAGCCYNCPLSYYTEDDCDLICVLHFRYDECQLETIDQRIEEEAKTKGKEIMEQIQKEYEEA